MKKRCSWAESHPLYLQYHDNEWGVPLHDDDRLFEFLILEGAQAGLSWLTILKKRAGYRAALDGFNAQTIANYDDAHISRLLQDTRIVRNRLKITGAVTNARAFLKVRESFGSFDAYIWQFVDGQPQRNTWTDLEAIPAETPASHGMSRDLRQRGFRFVGPTICYAFMQAVGMVNDHLMDCFRYTEV